jgi:hypothetical protein
MKIKPVLLTSFALNLALSITSLNLSYADKSIDTEEAEEIVIKSLGDAISNGTFKGLLRYSGQHRDSNLHLLQDSDTGEISNEKKQYYSSLGGYLGYETAPWFDTSVGATVYTSNPAGNNPDDVKGLGGLYEGNGGQDTYTVLGEAFVKYQNPKHLIKLGRQEMPNYRFVSLSDVRMTPITHEGAAYENTVFKDFKVNLAYIWRMKERNAKTFINMADGARLKVSANGKSLIRGHYDKNNYHDNIYTGDSKEMAMASVLYQTDAVDLELWNYYVDDFVNTTYAYGQYDFQSSNNEINYTLAAQFANQNDVGSNIAGDINTWFYGLKFQVMTQGFTFFTAYNEVKYDENSYDGGTIFVRWGTPQMFNSFQVQDSELAGEKSYGIGLQYDLGYKGIFPGMSLRVRYGNYNLPNSLSKTDARQDRSETTFDVNYSFSKESRFGNLDGLSMQFRVAYNNYDTNYDFIAYREYHGYGFESVTDDFFDLRLYLNYKF